MGESREVVVCNGCGNEYKKIGSYWFYSRSCIPELSTKQKDIFKGLLMGDAWIETTEKSARLSISMINEEFLEYLDSKFGNLTTGVNLKSTSEELAKRANENSIIGKGTKAENYSDLYRLQTRTHPFFKELRKWYSGAQKTIPDDLQLTPTIMKHWFVCDGCYHSKHDTPYCTLGMSNHYGNEEFIDSLFEDVGLKINTYNTSERENGSINMAAIINKNESSQLFDYMGKPLPDFEYKWPGVEQ